MQIIMVTVLVAGEHFITILERLGNMGDGEPSNPNGIKTILLTSKPDNRRNQNLCLECKFV